MAERAPAAAGRSAAFYCVSSGTYFLGAVAMINSLRLAGHREPVYVLDRGLSRVQREALGREATVVRAEVDAPPYLSKTIAPLAHPAEVMALIDADMIVTRRLDPLIDQVARGAVAAFRAPRAARHFPEWGELLDLGAVRRQPYLSSGLVLLGGETGYEVLRLLDDRQRRIDFERSYVRGHSGDHPLLMLDQDVLNAVLSSRVQAERVIALDPRLAPDAPFSGIRLLDERALRCAYEDGAEPYVLHPVGFGKPWLRRGGEDPYSRLLRRLLVADDLAIAPPQSTLPPRLRGGAVGSLARRGEAVRERLGERLRERLPRAALARLDERRLRRRRADR